MASIRHLLTKRPHTAWEHASAVGIKDCISTLRKRIPHPTWATPAHLLSRKMFAPSTGFACYWGFGIATITAAREHLPKMLAKKSHSCQSNTRQDTRLNACKKRAGFLLMGWVGQKRTLLSQVSSKCEDGFSFFPKLTPFLQWNAVGKPFQRLQVLEIHMKVTWKSSSLTDGDIFLRQLLILKV